MTSLFVVVPSMQPTGPVKGAVALCNGMANHIPVTLVPLKPSRLQVSGIDDRVQVSNLANCSGWHNKYRQYSRLLSAAGNRDRIVSLSMCLPADAFNAAFRHRAGIISSVRGNLFSNYRHDFGRAGPVLAQAHYALLRAFDHVLAMSDAMHQQLRSLGLRNVRTIRNFVDENYLRRFRSNHPHQTTRTRLLFVGSLSSRKRPDLLIGALRGLRDKNIDCELLFVGDGPLRPSLEQQAISAGLQDRVQFRGNIDDPFDVIQSAHLAVMPSESEGISRAMLESLYFGLPCVARRVDANEELINSSNGICFNKDEELGDAIETAINRFVAIPTPQRTDEDILIPLNFRQDANIQTMLELLA